MDAGQLERLSAVAALPEEQINASDLDAPESLDWSSATRGRFYRPGSRRRLRARNP